jgi:hypothetical protein
VDWIQGFQLPRQVLYPLSHATSPFVCILFLRQGLASLARAGLELVTILPPSLK